MNYNEHDDKQKEMSGEKGITLTERKTDSMSQAAAAASAMGGGAGNNFMNPAMGAGTAAASLAMRQAMKVRQKATAGTTAGVNSGGAGMKQRFENLETRLNALEGAGKDPVQSVQPIQEFVTGGSFGDASSTPPPPPCNRNIKRVPITWITARSNAFSWRSCSRYVW